MSALTNRPDACRTGVVLADGKLLVEVPWEAAEDLQAYLRAGGISTTLYLDPRTRTSRLQPWADQSADRAQSLVAQWQDTREAPRAGG
jgi:hypothetical protein